MKVFVLVLTVCVCLTEARNLNNRDVLKKLLTTLSKEKRQDVSCGDDAYTLCDNQEECVLWEKICDREMDCGDESDEGEWCEEFGFYDSGSGSGSGSGDYKRQYGSGSGSGSGSGDFKRQDGSGSGSGSGDFKRQDGSGSGSGSGDFKRQDGSGSGSGSGDFKRQDGSGSGSGSGSGDYKRLSGEAAVLKRLISLFDKEKKQETGRAEHKKRQEYICGGDRYLCASLDMCIPQDKVCDGHKDCDAGDDELRCPAKSKRQDLVCDDGYVPCDSMDMCTKIEEMCDGEKQCIDGSDEFPQYCDSVCEDGYVPCDSMDMCTKIEEMCDGEKQCIDGSDEFPQYCGETTESPEKRDTISIEITDETETTITEFEDFKPSKRRAVHNKRQAGKAAALKEKKIMYMLALGDPDTTPNPAKRDDDICTQVDTENKYVDDEGNTYIITSTTYEGNCLKKRQDEDCVCDQTDVQTDFDDGTTELSSTNKCTCLTLTPVSISKRQDEEECDYEEVYDSETDEVVAVKITCPFERGLSKLLASRQETADLCDCAQSTDPLNPGQTTFDVTQTCLCPTKVNKKKAGSKRRNLAAIKRKFGI